jgi:N12 class adenine-specific DNA methylase
MPRGLVTGAPVQDGAFAVGDDGKVYRGGAPQDGMAEEDRERLAGMLAVRDAAREVLRLNVEGGDDAALAEAQGALNAAYDGFVAAHGPLGLPQNRKLLEGDPDLPFLLALEKDYDPRAKTAVKAQIFSQRTIRRQVSPRQAETAKDALLVALNETGRVDWERMEGLTGLAARELQQQLAGEVFRNPEGGWETADAYLSGDVKSKLAAAEAAAQIDPAYHLNVEALREVQPPDLLPSQIHAAPGSPWVPPDVVTAFTQHLFGQTLVAHYVPTLAEWTLKPSHPYWFNRHSAAITKKWGTARVDGITLLHQALNGRAPRVTDPDPDDPDRRVVNPAETLAAREMQDKIKAEFARWAWAEPERAGRLAQIYNDRFNRIVPRKFDGAHLTLPGIGAAMPELRPQQKDAIWRVVQSRSNTLLGHRVGAGKTFAMIGAGMELRRLGLRNKVMHVIPNHMLEQYGDDFARMYPGAKVLLISARDLGARRAEVMSRIATEDWDAVVVTHNAFGKLPLSADTYTSFMRQEIAKLDAELHAIEQEGRDDVAGRHSVKSIEKAKKRMRVRMEKYAAAHTKDKTVTFEQTGVDHLFVDEADVFKNLYFPTRRSRVAGIAQSHSLRAFDMYMKSRYLQRHCGTCGRFVSPDGVCRSCLGKTTLATGGVTFATGTPISNSVVEMYTMMRYLMPERLRELGLEHFDAWATQFGDSVTALEMKPSGDGYREYTRFAKFNNVPELLRLFSEIADVKMDPEELGLALPGLAGGKAVAISAPPSPELKEFIQECAERADNLGSVDPSVDNMLKIIGEANLAALDMRLIDPSLPDDPHGKVNRAVEQILAVYQKTTGVEIETEKGIENMAQVVFLDVSTPKPGQFNVYDDLKAKLIAGGVPEDELAFIHDAKNDAAKQRLFDRVNAGRVRVIVGSTEKMGSGTNIQRRLAALHHLDAPWRPRDVEQREGRILRPGNMNAEVEIYRYVTEESFDVYKWQILQSKARFIAQVMTGDLQERSMEDIDAVTLGYAEMKALATGNPVIIEHIKTGGELQKLLSLRKAYHDKAHRTRLEIGSCHWRIEAARDNVARLRGALAAVAQAPQDFRATFGQASYGPQDKEAAGQAFMAALAAVEGTYKGEALGTLRGFPVIVEGRGPEQYPTARVRLTPDVEVAVTPGVSPAGNVTRLMNAVDSSTARIEAERKRIGEWQAQIAELTVELQKPFEREAEIATLQARLEELEAQIAELERGGRGEKDESAQDD